MKKIITLLFLSIIQHAFSQDLAKQLQGDWIKYKVEMKDGSKLFERLLKEDSYLRYSFKKDSLRIYTSPVLSYSHPVKYTVNGYKIKVPSTSLTIEKITNDTLIIAEDNDNFPDDRLKRHFFARKLTCTLSDLNNQGIFIANAHCSPTLSKEISIARASGSSSSIKNFTMSGKIRIHLNDKKVETVIDSCSINNQNYLNKIIEAINNSYPHWDTKGFEKYKIVEVPFSAYGINDLNGFKGSKRRFGNIHFLTTGRILESYATKTIEEMTLSTDYYKKGLEAFKDSKFEKAIEYFTKSYEFDDFNIEALYSRAAIYYHIGKKAEACADWKILADLGQKRGIDAYNQYCN